MSKLGDIMNRLFSRGPGIEVPDVPPLPEVATHHHELMAAKRRSSNLDRRYAVIQEVLFDYKAQDGALIPKRQR